MSEARVFFLDLLDHIKADVHATLNQQPSPADQATLQQLLTGLDALTWNGLTPSASQPAIDRWLPPAAALAPGHHRAMAAAFLNCAPHLHWNRSYVDEPTTVEMEAFWANYAYAGVAVPEEGFCPPGPFHSETTALYLTCQGAGLVYPEHHHPAVEIYGVVSGTADWLRADEGYRPRQPGSVFVHASEMAHATTTTNEATISWVAWLGDLTHPAAFSR